MRDGDARAAESAPRSKKDVIAEQLRRDIASGRIAPGEKLSEARLAQRFGVSRMPVRDAIKELETAGFVTVEQRRGTFVKQLRKHDLLDLFEVREAVEGMAARLCATRAGNEVLSRVDDVMEAMRIAVESGDLDAYGPLGGRLHELVLEGSGNERLVEHHQLLVQHLGRGPVSSVVTDREEWAARSFREHQALVAALLARDGEAAERAMRDHVRSSRRLLQHEGVVGT